MITESGIIYIDQEPALFPEMTEDIFLSSRLGKKARKLLFNGEYHSYKIEATLNEGLESVITVFFRKKRIFMVILYPHINQEDRGWSTWTKEKEQRKKKLNDTLLEKYCGLPPYIYSWGRIASVYDSKSGSSDIVVTYKES